MDQHNIITLLHRTISKDFVTHGLDMEKCEFYVQATEPSKTIRARFDYSDIVIRVKKHENKYVVYTRLSNKGKEHMYGMSIIRFNNINISRMERLLDNMVNRRLTRLNGKRRSNL